MEGDGADFDQLAARIWEHQSERLPVLRRYASRTGRPPTEVTPLPVAAFKYGLLHDGVAPPVHVFESSGTSGAAKSRSVFSEPGLALMDAAIDALARRWLFPDQERTVILVLAPSLERAPGMIMAYGMRRLIARFGRKPVLRWDVDRGWSPQAERPVDAHPRGRPLDPARCGAWRGRAPRPL